MEFSGLLDQDPVLKQLCLCANQMQIESYLIGGFVRDLILSRDSKDIDVVCIGSGIELAESFHQSMGGKGEVHVFKNFGTAMVKLPTVEVEFVGARKESYRRESRKPMVENGTLSDDQNRRDFTINALAIGLSASNFGQLIDPFQGIEDIEQKIIRTPLDPEITFSDDPLRMMRACRFASQLGFDIHPDTFEALIRNKDRISIVSMERITDELNKIILSPKPSYGFKLLHAAGLLEIIFPEFVALLGAETKDGKGHKDNFYHTLQVLDNLSQRSNDLWHRWAAILHDIAKPVTKRFDAKVGWTFHGHEEKGAKMVPVIFRRLRLPLNEKMRFVQKLVRMHLRPIPLVKNEVTDSALRRLLFEAGEDTEALLQLCRADITSKNDQKVKRFLHNLDIVEQKLKEVEEKDKVRTFQPAFDGEQIMQLFQLQPGKEVGLLKSALREAIIHGQIENEYEVSKTFLKQKAIEMGISVPF